MEEQLISFETAKLAKEKGFNIDVIYYYDFIGDKCSDIHKTNYNSSKEEIYSAPTQALLQKWLRETRDQDVFIVRDGNHYLTVNNASGMPLQVMSEIISNLNWKRYTTYEEALEVGLIEALKLIK